MVESNNYKQFRPGQQYEVKIVHLGTNLETPDYDYTAQIEANSLPAGVVMVIDDPYDPPMLGVHGESSYFYAAGKTAYVTLVKIKSQTVSTIPSNRDRTTLGIGEEVTCSTDPSISVQWSVTGGGSVSPATGTSTTFTASKSPSSPTVHAVIGTADATKDFTVIAPSSNAYSKDQDSPPWTPWSSGTKYLGARTLYDVTINPTTVSLYNVQFQENFGSGQTDTWPDSSTWYGPTGEFPFTVNYANEWYDEQSTGLYNSNKLYTGSVWQDFSPDFDIPIQYKNESSSWDIFHTPTGGREYYHSDRKSRVKVGSQNGGLQGPWQSP